ncbi:MAG: hypothetical protein HYV34_02500 [Candidatus Kerfeldbacteria bacterium]|nr:hypothetical protein [Candidatus Kerfeldbacteria bacterium]
MKHRSVLGLVGLAFALAMVIGCSEAEPKLKPGECRLISDNRVITQANALGIGRVTRDGRYAYDVTADTLLVVWGDCNIRFQPVAGRIIDMDKDLSAYQAEKVCGDEWVYSDCIRVANNLFPSDFSDTTRVIRTIKIEETRSTDSTLVPLNTLDPTRRWSIGRHLGVFIAFSRSMCADQ